MECRDTSVKTGLITSMEDYRPEWYLYIAVLSIVASSTIYFFWFFAMCIIYYGLLYRQTLFIEYIICVGTDCVILAGSSIVIDINDKEKNPSLLSRVPDKKQ